MNINNNGTQQNDPQIKFNHTGKNKSNVTVKLFAEM